jgi:hypothetical protein
MRQRSLTPHPKVVTTRSQLDINVEKLSPKHEAQASRLKTSRLNVRAVDGAGWNPLPEKGACRWPLRLRTQDALFPGSTHQPPPSSGEFGSLAPIYRWITFARLRNVEKRFELFELL